MAGQLRPFYTLNFMLKQGCLYYKTLSYAVWPIKSKKIGDCVVELAKSSFCTLWAGHHNFMAQKVDL